MFIEQIDENEKSIRVAVPLTKTRGRARVKRRSVADEYGVPVATRREPITEDCYVEWQMGYDELSECVWYFHKWGFISVAELSDLRSKLSELSDENLFDQSALLSIKRSHPVEKKLNGVDFSFSLVEYPLLIHRFNGFEIVTEIIIKEKQYAIGVQPMLYFCFPVTTLSSRTTPLIGRVAEKNESALFEINRENCGILLKLLYLFGMLSNNHKEDILRIIETTIKTVKKNA